jgi:hypothetical protein
MPTTDRRSEVKATLPSITAKRTARKHHSWQNQSYHAIKNGSPPQLSKTFKTPKRQRASARFNLALANQCASAYFQQL